MKPAQIYYLNKVDNSPLYTKSKELHKIEFARGWVEYLLETSDIYFQFGLTEPQYQHFLPAVLDKIKSFYLDQDVKLMSLLRHLVIERMDHKFSLPLFVDHRQGNIITCGNLRFSANVLAGVLPSEMPTVIQTEKNSLQPSELSHLITGTDQLDELSGIDQYEFLLDFSQGSHPVVLSSVLTNSIYYKDPTSESFSSDGLKIFEFWNKFTQDGLINLTVSCNVATRDLIKFDPKIWNVTYSQLEHNGFGFGQILEKFAEQKTPGLNLYVYNISEPLYLEYLLPWGHSNIVWSHTLNKQVHLFETTRGAATACWPIQAMGNFVK